jgi:anaerobic ribonucleoside-triphosphate reductase
MTSDGQEFDSAYVLGVLGVMLKPCPCCGAEARIQKMGIMCPKCNLQMPFGHVSIVGRLVERWNSRVKE